MAEQISNLLEKVSNNLSTHIERKGISDESSEILSGIKVETESILEKIREFERFIRLDLQEETAHIVDFDGMSVNELTINSRLIGAIHRAGVTISSVAQFSKTESFIAEALAAKFKLLSSHLKSFRASRKSEKDDSYSFLTKGGEGFCEFVELLEKYNVIQTKKALLKKDGNWPLFKREWWQTSTDKQDLLVVYEVSDANLRQFLFGDWMTSFVTAVIRDHLVRNLIDHEIFSKVKYSAPVDVIQSNSDFDVISIVGGAVLCFECKSGTIDHAMATEVQLKSNEINLVLENFAPDVDKIEFYIVFDETINDEKYVKNLFENGNVQPIKIDEIRHLIFSMFTLTKVA